MTYQNFFSGLPRSEFSRFGARGGGGRGWSEFPSQIWRGLSFLGLSFPDLGREGGQWSEFSSQIWRGLSFLCVLVFQIWGGGGGGRDGLSFLVRFGGT